MSSTVISVEHLSKVYRLGQIGTGTFARDLNVWWARMRGAPNPMLRIGESDHGNRLGEEVWALKDVSFSVEQGEVLGIIGRNGAGKSTLLKILSRITAPTNGVIRGNGRVASLLEVGTGFHPELTGRENIYLNGAILGMTKQEVTRKFDEIVDFAEVEKFIDTPVKRYSSGMYVRLAFAVAAHLESEILIVDEVLAVGDAEFQTKCLGKMSNVARSGRTVLFVSHNMGAVRSLCSKVMLFEKGQCEASGESADITALYINKVALDTGASEVLVKPNQHKKGNGIAQITKISVFKNDEKRNTFSVFEPFSICNEIVSMEDFIGSCWVLILDQYDQVILSSFQYDTNSLYTFNKGKHSCTIEFDKNCLAPGRYVVSAGIFGRHNEFVDWVDKVITLEIERRMISGKPYDQRLGLTTLPLTWKLRKM